MHQLLPLFPTSFSKLDREARKKMQYFALVSFVCIVQVKLHLSFCSERLTFNIIPLIQIFRYNGQSNWFNASTPIYQQINPFKFTLKLKFWCHDHFGLTMPVDIVTYSKKMLVKRKWVICLLHNSKNVFFFSNLNQIGGYYSLPEFRYDDTVSFLEYELDNNFIF